MSALATQHSVRSGAEFGSRFGALVDQSSVGAVSPTLGSAAARGAPDVDVAEKRLGGGNEGMERDREVSLAISGERGPSVAEGCGQLLGLLDRAVLEI